MLVTNFRIFTNVKLTTVPAFDMLTGAGAWEQFAEFTGNTELSACCDLLRFFNGRVTVDRLPIFPFNNAPECNTAFAIREACTTVIDDPADVAPTTLTRINGNLTIGGTITSFPDFRFWSPWRVIFTIEGLSDASLTDLENIFPVLQEVRGHLSIRDNDEVQTITGFVSLREVVGFVEIGGSSRSDGNAALTAAPAFDALETIGGTIFIAK